MTSGSLRSRSADSILSRRAIPKTPRFEIGDPVRADGAVGRVKWVFNSLFAQWVVYAVEFPNLTHALILYEIELSPVRPS